ncbi:MAG: hypothetical protein MI923_17370 [Phycisphaerales bacterium]|nr:hypothetical protein [Phycisphaerales bacterium]
MKTITLHSSKVKASLPQRDCEPGFNRRRRFTALSFNHCSNQSEVYFSAQGINHPSGKPSKNHGEKDHILGRRFGKPLKPRAALPGVSLVIER